MKQNTKQNMSARQQPRDWDILCSKDKTMSRHPGNQLFRKTVKLAKDRYRLATDNATKSIILREIVDNLRINHGCRFVKFHKETQTLIELDATEIRDKVGHALRFAVKGNNQRRNRRQTKSSTKTGSQKTMSHVRSQPKGRSLAPQTESIETRALSPACDKVDTHDLRSKQDCKVDQILSDGPKQSLKPIPFDISASRNLRSSHDSDDIMIAEDWTLEDKGRFYHVFQRQQEILEEIEDDDDADQEDECEDPLDSSQQSDCSYTTSDTTECTSMELLELDCSPEPLYHFSVHDLADFLPEILELPTMLEDAKNHENKILL